MTIAHGAGFTVSVKPADAPTPGNDFLEIACPVLRLAASEVAKRWSDLRSDAVNAQEANDVLLQIARAVAGRVANETLIADGARSVLGRRLLERLRTEFLRAAEALDSDPRMVIETIQRIELVRGAIEPNWSDEFSSRLGMPSGLDLVVEVAHDIRSPLSSILFLAETMQRGQSGSVTATQHRQLGLIYSAALGLSAVASDMIELARGGEGLVDRTPVPFSLAETLAAVRDIVKPIAEEKDLEMRLRSGQPDERLGHPLALNRVLLNLTTNALKFTDSGVVELTALATDEERVEFSVRDTGRGITDDALQVLFEPFRRAGGREGYCFSGTGLGLAICRKLVEAMGSSLQVETDPSWGTRFFFELRLPLLGTPSA